MPCEAPVSGWRFPSQELDSYCLDPLTFVSYLLRAIVLQVEEMTYIIKRAFMRFNYPFCILEARHIAEALHIPYEPADPTDFREWSRMSQWDMVRILSRGPLQTHILSRRGAILEALFRISEGLYFGPHHLIMVALLHLRRRCIGKGYNEQTTFHCVNCLTGLDRGGALY
ncbi:hypothetical protein CK203_064775 [Vitis vinifera]|uniref:Uncharacterized protein n=1 Tax=Vitis vinifera TaxID=29760 RepID=A0A438FQ11_VITVI|nr:hypothetical protein CK203_064775 [Vitis vinifera]